MAGLVEIVAGTGGIINVNIDETIKMVLHAHTPELGEVLRDVVAAKTPVLTGALQSDWTYEVVPDTNNDDLVYVYAEGIEQVNEWGREYVQYVEGPPLGETTWTNPPRLILMQTSEGDGLGLAAAWATVYVIEALVLCAMASGVPWP